MFHYQRFSLRSFQELNQDFRDSPTIKAKKDNNVKLYDKIIIIGVNGYYRLFMRFRLLRYIRP